MQVVTWLKLRVLLVAGWAGRIGLPPNVKSVEDAATS